MSFSTINAANISFYDNYRFDFFAPKVTINSHTPLDEKTNVKDDFSKKDFYQTSSKINNKLTLEQKPVQQKENNTPTDSAIVKNMIEKGYSGQDAIKLNTALNAYGLDVMYSNGTKLVSTVEAEA